MHVTSPGFSSSIDLKAFRRESRRLFAYGLLFAVMFHAGLGVFLTTRRPAERRTVHESARWILRADIIEVPRISPAPLNIAAHPSVRKPLLKPGFSPKFPMREFTGRALPPPLPEPPEFRWKTGPEAFQPRERVDGASDIDSVVPRAPDNRIPLPRDIGPDPGMFRANIVYNPAFKNAAQGFVHIPLVRGEHLKKFDQYILSLRGLVEGLNRFTNITAVLDRPRFQDEAGGVGIDSLASLRTPVVYILADRTHPITGDEWNHLEAYLARGGFPIIESGEPGNVRLREELRGALSTCAKAAIEPIPKDHPLFHCFFDFDDGPPKGAGPELGAVPHTVQPFLEGIFFRGRLVAVYSDLGYGLTWGASGNRDEQLKMGVNLVVYGIVQHKERPGHRRIALE